MTLDYINNVLELLMLFTKFLGMLQLKGHALT